MLEENYKSVSLNSCQLLGHELSKNLPFKFHFQISKF